MINSIFYFGFGKAHNSHPSLILTFSIDLQYEERHKVLQNLELQDRNSGKFFQPVKVIFSPFCLSSFPYAQTISLSSDTPGSVLLCFCIQPALIDIHTQTHLSHTLNPFLGS